MPSIKIDTEEKRNKATQELQNAESKYGRDTVNKYLTDKGVNLSGDTINYNDKVQQTEVSSDTITPNEELGSTSHNIQNSYTAPTREEYGELTGRDKTQADIDATNSLRDENGVVKIDASGKKDIEKVWEGEQGYVPPVETPTVDGKTTTTDGETPEVPEIKDVPSFKAAGSTLDNLTALIETKYGADATIEGNTVTASINGIDYAWNIDKGGNPIKTQLGQTKQEPQDYFNGMMIGQDNADIKTRNTAEYKNAKERKSNYDKFSSMNAQGLSDSMLRGEFLPGTKEYDDIKTNNPELFNEANSLYNINVVNTELIAKNEGKTEEVTMTQKISDYVTKLMTNDTYTDINKVLSENETVKTINAELTKEELKKNELLDQIQNVEDDMREELGGKSVNKSYFNARVSERTRSLTRAANLSIANINSLGGQLKNISDDVKYEIELSRQQEQDQMNKFQFAYGLYQDSLPETPKESTPDKVWTKLNDGTLYNQVTGETKDLGLTKEEEIDGGTWKKLDDNTLYNEKTGTFKDRITGEETADLTTGEKYAQMDFSRDEDLLKEAAANNEASVKNNNPAGLTYGVTDELKQMWVDAGVKFSKGSARPSDEGNNYIHFDSVKDGLNAYSISLTKRGDDVDTRLQTWVGYCKTEECLVNRPTYTKANAEKYSREIMTAAGIPEGAKFSELSNRQIASLMSKQMAKESPVFHKGLLARAGSPEQTTEDRGITGVLGVPISYERQIKQMVPATLMNSEIELEQLNSTIQAMDKAGLPVEDAVLTYLGFNVTGDNRGQAMEFVDVGRNMGDDVPDRFYSTVSNYMNNGDFGKANQYVGNQVDKLAKEEFGEDFISKPTMNQLTKDKARMEALINANPDKIGAFDGRVSDFLRKFKDMPEMQELNTLLTMTQAETRKHFAGSAVTPAEMTALADFIGGNDKMNGGNLVTMLRTIHERTNSLFLEQRNKYGYTPIGKTKNTNDPLNINTNTANNDPLDLGL